jgi:hypothetical protein
MADKSANPPQAPNGADAAGEGKAVNKQTAKVVQDGVELSWDLLREGELKPEEAADFYVHSVEALRRFRERDPRTEPALRKEKKLKDERGKAFANVFLGIVMGAFLMVFLGGYRGCASDYDSPRRYYRR